MLLDYAPDEDSLAVIYQELRGVAAACRNALTAHDQAHDQAYE